MSATRSKIHLIGCNRFFKKTLTIDSDVCSVSFFHTLLSHSSFLIFFFFFIGGNTLKRCMLVNLYSWFQIPAGRFNPLLSWSLIGSYCRLKSQPVGRTFVLDLYSQWPSLCVNRSIFLMIKRWPEDFHKHTALDAEYQTIIYYTVVVRYFWYQTPFTKNLTYLCVSQTNTFTSFIYYWQYSFQWYRILMLIK